MSSYSNNILLSTAYLPPIEYFYFIQKADKIWIETHETYPKQTYRNRCQIYATNGQLDLSIPVKKPNGNNSLSSEMLIANENKWQLNHWRAIESAYNTSAFFLYFKDELSEYYSKSFNSLITFNTELLHLILKLSGIKKEILFTSDYEKEPKDKLDLRNVISPKSKFKLTKQKRYFQVFEEKHGFIPNLSIIDLLFNEGPNTTNYLKSISLKENNRNSK